VSFLNRRALENMVILNHYRVNVIRLYQPEATVTDVHSLSSTHVRDSVKGPCSRLTRSFQAGESPTRSVSVAACGLSIRHMLGSIFESCYI
jgi:hypothetical protein